MDIEFHVRRPMDIYSTLVVSYSNNTAGLNHLNQSLGCLGTIDSSDIIEDQT